MTSFISFVIIDGSISVKNCQTENLKDHCSIATCNISMSLGQCLLQISSLADLGNPYRRLNCNIQNTYIYIF